MTVRTHWLIVAFASLATLLVLLVPSNALAAERPAKLAPSALAAEGPEVPSAPDAIPETSRRLRRAKALRTTGYVLTGVGLTFFGGGALVGSVVAYDLWVARSGGLAGPFLFAALGLGMLSVPFLAVGLPLAIVGNRRVKRARMSVSAHLPRRGERGLGLSLRVAF